MGGHQALSGAVYLFLGDGCGLSLGAGDVLGAPAGGHQKDDQYDYGGDGQVCFVHGESGVFQ